MSLLDNWLKVRWQPSYPELIHDYSATFSTEPGKRVLQDLVDTIYAVVYDGSDPSELASHNGGRAVIHRILDAIDRAENPRKYPDVEADPAEEFEERET